MTRGPAGVAIVVTLLGAGCMGAGGTGGPQSSSSDLAADFTVEPGLPAVGEVVRFVDTSRGQPARWVWAFGDGTLSAERDPSHAYDEPGRYEIRLLVEDAEGFQDEAVRTLEVRPLGSAGPAGSEFAVDFRASIVGLSVDFEPVVHPADAVVDAYFWSFGDGSSSHDSAPIHDYAGPGAYEVKLRASSQGVLAEASHVVGVGVLVPTESRLLNRSFAVVAVLDTGINPYHEEFRDAEFQEHPATFLHGYPAEAIRLQLALEARSYAEAFDRDRGTWGSVPARKLHWIPGTRIIGALSADLQGAHRILDDNGHGTITASDAVGARIGSCPGCLVVAIEATTPEGLDWALGWAADQPWIDVISNSWTVCILTCEVDTGLLPGVVQSTAATKRAVEGGKHVVFAAGNGAANRFDAPTPTWWNALTGPDWVVTVGASDPSSGATVVGTGRPVDVTAPGVNYKGALHQSMTAIGEFSGTSLSAPVVAGALARVTMEARAAFGDVREGPRPGGVVAEGRAGKGLAADGKVTRAEVERSVYLTARRATGTAGAPPLMLPDSAAAFAYAGYGVVDARSARDAVEVVLGARPVPARADEDAWASADSRVRQAIWGSWNPGGDATLAREDETPVSVWRAAWWSGS